MRVLMLGHTCISIAWPQIFEEVRVFEDSLCELGGYFTLDVSWASGGHMCHTVGLKPYDPSNGLQMGDPQKERLLKAIGKYKHITPHTSQTKA